MYGRRLVTVSRALIAASLSLFIAGGLLLTESSWRVGLWVMLAGAFVSAIAAIRERDLGPIVATSLLGTLLIALGGVLKAVTGSFAAGEAVGLAGFALAFGGMWGERRARRRDEFADLSDSPDLTSANGRGD